MPETHPAQDNESKAADWIASILGGSPCRRDIPPEQRRHDYDIVMPDCSTIALEVTRHISEADAEYTGITKNPNERSWHSRGLVNDWCLAIDTPDDGKQVGRRIHKRLELLRAETPALLEEMERTREKVTYVRPYGPVSPLVEKLRALGIRVVCCESPSGSSDGGRVRVEAYFPSGSVGDEIPVAVQKPIADNLRKLLKAKRDGAREAHLFVWLELGPRSWAPVAVMSAGRSPRSVPDLQGLDVVWVAIHDGHNPHKWGLWRCTSDGWSLLRDPSRAASSGSLVLWDDWTEAAASCGVRSGAPPSSGCSTGQQLFLWLTTTRWAVGWRRTTACSSRQCFS